MSIDDQRSRNWCFTLNNYTVDDLHEIDQWTFAYLVVGREIGDEKKTPHLQGYVEFANAHKGAAVRQGFGGRGHWEPRRGTAPQASDYCKKEGTFMELGVMGRQGRRTDLNEIGEAIMSGDSIADVAADHPGTYIKFHKGIAALKSVTYSHRTEPPHVTWLWGEAGTGKTRTAVEHSPNSFYIKDGTQWWDGYNQEDVIVIDDFEPCKWPYRDFLRLLDRYPYQGQVKGGYVAVNSPHIFITCEHPPTSYWTGNELAQVARRITDLKQITGVEDHAPAAVAEQKTERITHHPLPDFIEPGDNWPTDDNIDDADIDYDLPELEEDDVSIQDGSDVE